MKKNSWAKWIITLLISVLTMSSAISADYRVAYFEVGSNDRYDAVYQACLKTIKNNEWQNKFEFPPEVHISVGPDSEEVADQKAKSLIERTDINAIIVMGTFGTRAMLKNYDGRLPILSEVVTDALKEGFVPSELDSGKDNFTVSIAPSRFKLMFRVFYQEVGFKKLGLMYSDAKNRNKETNMDDAEIIGQEREFLVIPYNLSEHDLKDNTEGCVEGLKILLKKGMDAFFIPSLNCFKTDISGSGVKTVMDVLLEHKIPTFARRGSKYVRSGAMMGFVENFDAQGKLLAEKLFKVLVKKQQPTELPMVDNSWPRVVLNLAVARQIGFKLSPDILGASDEIYQDMVFPLKMSDIK